MSEEKAGGIFRVLVPVSLMLCALGVVWFLYAGLVAQSSLSETKTLTILHTWEEGGQYYFADELGCVYLIACKGDIWKTKEEIRYDDMPKIRYDKLEVGQRYNVEYVVRQGNVRLSLGEKEMER